MYKRHYLALIAILLLALGMAVVFLNYESRPAPINSTPAGRYNIQVVLKAKANPPDFWRVVQQGIDVAAQEFGVDCEVAGPMVEKDIDGQISLMRAAIAKSPDAIIVAAADYEQLAAVCQEATDAGILLVTVDSDVNLAQRRCFVGSDNYEIGKMLAMLVDELLAGDERFGVMGHVAATTTAQGRKNGLVENVRGMPQRMAAIDYCDGSEELSKERTLKMLREHPDIRCMVGLNESSALGVVRAVQELGRQNDIQVIACDSSEKQISYMEDGTIQAFVIQNPFNMGYLSVENTVRLLKGDVSVPEVISTESVVIKKEDLFRQENQKLLFPFTGGPGPSSAAASQ